MKTFALLILAAVTLSACANTCERPPVHDPVVPCKDCRWNEK